MIQQETIPCKTCGKSTTFLGTKLCDPCHNIQARLASYLNNENAIQFVSEALNKAKKVKPLAQYLAEYLATGIDRTHEAGLPMDFTEEGLKPIFENALDAYESTENVTIKIERA